MHLLSINKWERKNFRTFPTLCIYRRLIARFVNTLCIRRPRATFLKQTIRYDNWKQRILKCAIQTNICGNLLAVSICMSIKYQFYFAIMTTFKPIYLLFLGLSASVNETWIKYRKQCSYQILFSTRNCLPLRIMICCCSQSVDFLFSVWTYVAVDFVSWKMRFCFVYAISSAYILVGLCTSFSHQLTWWVSTAR